MKNNMKKYTEQEYKKDELLAIIAANLELDATRKQQMESAYRAVNTVLSKDEDFFKDLTINVYAQGSLLIGTTIKPLPGKEFDLDIVLHIESSYLNHTPAEIYDELYRVLSNHDTYKTLLKKKNRCVRIDYNSDFHMDILPGCMISLNNNRLMIPEDNRRISWSRTHPKGYGEWFKEIAERNKSSFLLQERYNLMLEAKIETEDLPLDIYLKTPLQRTVQIVKRYRDLYYQNRDTSKEPAVSSIVLTTLLAQCHEGNFSIQEALKNAVLKLKKLANDYKFRKIKFAVYNPVDNHEDADKRENFTDSWEDKHYESFVGFVEDFDKKLNAFIGADTNENNYKDLFGNGYYKENVQRLVELEERLKGKPMLTNLLAGAAYTDSNGHINGSTGVKNATHRFYAQS
ncbi:nucleotidyltransferase [Flavobacterium sp. 140616W15]|uniref:nucleotidyltransferase domain-containing protein n=1 Tax=Flavobacterium sp. 140616W15 TaxID=2478552 RepID=UPI000F0C50E3|nr:nucleotidyltransferase [Flavobacterium sp. 140616W15]AYN04793.1 nucleotidyltransferase [Flavobacterium sp. 140616W15]